MKEFTCIVCGKKGIDASYNGRKFCSAKCRNRYRYFPERKVNRAIPACRYNAGVDCEQQECAGCGWNPEEEKRRKEILHERQAEDAKRYP